MNSNPSCTKATALSTCPLPSSSPLGAVSCACMVSHFSRVQLFANPWTVAHQAPLSMGFSRKEYWNGLPWPPLEDLPKPRIEPAAFMSPALAGKGSLPLVPPGKCWYPNTSLNQEIIPIGSRTFHFPWDSEEDQKGTYIKRHPFFTHTRKTCWQK